MSRYRRGLGYSAVVIGLLCTCAVARADAPKIDGITPFGAQRGVSTEVSIAGGNLAGSIELIAPFAFKLDSPPAPNKEAGKWALKATVAPSTPIGIYVVRVRTDDGLSNPFLFAVGQLPQIAEKEDNNTFELAQKFTAPAVIEGQASGNDVDYFRFTGKKGERVVVDAQCARIGSGVDPSIRLTTSTHKYVASADDSPGLLTDARLTAVLPVDGDYIVEISDSRYQGGGRAVYRLVVGAVPVADEVFPLGGRRGEAVGFELKGGTLPAPSLAVATVQPLPGLATFAARFSDCMLGLASATPSLDVESLPGFAVSDYPEVREPADPAAPPLRLLPPVVINGRVENKGDQDRFTIIVTPGQKYHVEVDAANFGSALDGILEVRSTANAQIAQADDTTAQGGGRNSGNRRNQVIASPDPTLTFTAPAGQTEVTLVLRDLKGDGGLGYPYRIVVEPNPVSFDLSLGDAQISIPKGGTVAVPVSLSRQGYNGPVTITVADPPKGLTVRPGTILDGLNAGVFTITAAPDLTLPVQSLKVVGRAKGPAGALEEFATKTVVFSSQGAAPATLPTNHVEFTGLPAAPALAKAVKIDVPEAAVEIVHGYGGNVPVKLTRSKDADAALTIAPIVSPAGQPLPSLGVPLTLSTGLAIPNATVAAKAADGVVVVNAAPEAPLGLATVAVAAKGKIANKDQTFDVPLIQVNVVRPASLEVPATLDIKAGTTVELKGKLLRKAPFKEPVVIKLDGLPAGLKAEPATVAPDKTDFVVKITADAKAAVATGAAKVVPAFQLNKKDYATPPSPLAVKVLSAK